MRNLLTSVALHAAVLVGLGTWSLVRPSGPTFGSDNPLAGGTVGITTVDKIPIFQRKATPNPLANDSEFTVPEQRQPKPQPKQEDPDAIALKSRKNPEPVKAARPTPVTRTPTRLPDRPTAVTSETGRAVSNPMYGLRGTGGVGLTEGSPFRGRFGWYEAQIRQLIAQKWRTSELDPRLQTAPVAMVYFEILRDGSARAIRVTRSSGNYALDSSTQRAVYDVGRFPPLPPGFERNTASVEVQFQLQR